MNFEKLKKKREKHRLKVIKKYGNDVLKLFPADEISIVDRVLTRIENNYISGAGSCWVSMTEITENRKKEFLKYILSLDIVKSATLETIEDENYPLKLSVKYCT